MKRIVTSILLVLAVLQLRSQTVTADSVIIGNGYANKAFYSFQNGTVATMPNNNWDLAVAVYGIQTASIRINGGFGTRLWQYTAGDTTAWNALDTTGLASGTGWIECFDQDTAYEPSAFEYNMTGHPNYGWGVYNSVTHDVNGIALFVTKTYTGSFKKVWVKNQKATTNTMTIRVANLNGSNDTTITFSKTYSNKNYVYIALDDLVVKDLEPANNTYELIFDKYNAFINPPGIYYPVAGVRLNRNIQASEARNIHENDAIYTDYVFSDNMTVIGHDWKIQPPPVWVIVDSLSYFVVDNPGNVWQIWFTGFTGSSSGKYYFNKRQVAFASIEDENNTVVKATVYPNPASEQVQIIYSNETPTNGALQVFDMTGKVVYNAILLPTSGALQVINCQPKQLGWNAGVYVVHVSINGKNAVQKLIIK
ncbi:MAG: T9SS type A sorting domain-containing protein [Flavobacteriales bacterium]|nr:T9SS type A sorting domain-containing protein [Flavobacteriales bacterium]